MTDSRKVQQDIEARCRRQQRMRILVGSRTPPRPPGVLPDAAHRDVRPGTALLRLETTGDRSGALDGAWWPRSRDVTAELPKLITALTEYLGPVQRVGLDACAWEHLPTRLVIDGRIVHIDSSRVGDDTAMITRGEHDLFALLVVPPHATPEAAREAMARAVRTDTVTQAGQILVDTGAGSRTGDGPVQTEQDGPDRALHDRT